MSYATVALMRRDYDLANRVAACVAVEGISDYPEQWAGENAWALAAQPGWAEAWESAVVSHPDPDYRPALDEGVITDGMILSAVQSLHAVPPVEESAVVESDPEEV
ncbi:hypothetical protein SEA_RASOVI_22 [Microbacterium phage Rasovi]|nr:hypothetical protein SEA_RASOVI_22 [Microbacterium phage Rasovi]